MNRSEQLTELRDALRGIRSELSLKALKDYISVFLPESELKSVLVADDVVRALWYCLWNNNANRNDLIAKLYHFFMATKEGENSKNRKPEEVRELISMILFLGGVDFQMNPIEIDEEAYQNDMVAMPSQSQETGNSTDRYEPKENARKIRKRRLWLICAFGIITVALIGALCYKSCHKNTVEPEGNPVGTVVSTKGTDIMLWEHQRNGAYSLEAVSKRRNGKFAEEKVFQTPDGSQSFLSAMKSDKWYCSNPDYEFFAFNEGDTSLYVPLIKRDTTYTDRYVVYHFNGQCFMHKSLNSAGYWLHPSLQVFDSLFAIGKTDKHVVRIDYVKNGFRYAAWNIDKTMKDEPDLILYNNGTIEDDKIEFMNASYRYIFNYGTNNLWVYNGNKPIGGSHNMEILFKSTK